jgi:hypothetical protein
MRKAQNSTSLIAPVGCQFVETTAEVGCQFAEPIQECLTFLARRAGTVWSALSAACGFTGACSASAAKQGVSPACNNFYYNPLA